MRARASAYGGADLMMVLTDRSRVTPEPELTVTLRTTLLLLRENSADTMSRATA